MVYIFRMSICLSEIQTVETKTVISIRIESIFVLEKISKKGECHWMASEKQFEFWVNKNVTLKCWWAHLKCE